MDWRHDLGGRDSRHLQVQSAYKVDGMDGNRGLRRRRSAADFVGLHPLPPVAERGVSPYFDPRTLFIFQSIAGLVIGVIVLAILRLWVAILGAGFAISTVVGFLLSVEVGLFGFQGTWSAPYAHLALVVQGVATVVFIVMGTLCLIGQARTRLTGSSQARTFIAHLGHGQFPR